MNRKLVTVIMAAGKGKRMKNPDKSKVMYEFKGKPMIEHVTELAMKINSENILPIVGHMKQSVIEHLGNRFPESNDKIKYAHQDEQLGTGHAVMQTEELLKDFDGDVLILSGDVPMLSFETVNSFLNFHRENKFDASLISAVFEDPTGYGRVLRDPEGNFIDIREEKDCNEEERKCKEINSGIYLIDNKILFEALKTLKTENAQGEYYLTDIFKYFKSIGKKIGAFPVKNTAEISGINTVEQLEELERIFDL
ncbi:MAG: NTP transferase domain-containing protein [Ignavibacteriae bacterium]|nr:NTP transferase domain-containing protein [Ignavibacteriota bacterium]